MNESTSTTPDPAKPLTVIVLGPEWFNGTLENGGANGATSKLLMFDHNNQRRQCCIGIACTQLGVPDTVIVDRDFADQLPLSLVPEPLKFMHCRTQLATDIYFANDRQVESSTPDEWRLTMLNRLAEPYGLKFVLAPNVEAPQDV